VSQPASPRKPQRSNGLKTIDGPVVARDCLSGLGGQRVAGDQKKVEIVISDGGRIIFGTCGCAFFQRQSAEQRPGANNVALFRLSAALAKGFCRSQWLPLPEALPVTTNMATGERMKKQKPKKRRKAMTRLTKQRNEDKNEDK